MSISFIEDYRNQGVEIVSAGTTLLPVPVEHITFIDPDLIEIDFSFAQVVRTISYPNDIRCAYFFDVEPNGGSRSFNSGVLTPDSNNKVRIPLPLGGLASLTTLIIGYSPGIFGGHSKSYYANMSMRVAYYYNIATFDLTVYKYPFKHERGERVIMKYTDAPKQDIYIGNSTDIVAYIDGKYTIGN